MSTKPKTTQDPPMLLPLGCNYSADDQEVAELLVQFRYDPAQLKEQLHQQPKIPGGFRSSAVLLMRDHEEPWLYGFAWLTIDTQAQDGWRAVWTNQRQFCVEILKIAAQLGGETMLGLLQLDLLVHRGMVSQSLADRLRSKNGPPP